MNEEESTFFFNELQEQVDYEYDIQWDDCSYGGIDVESYDP